MTESEKVAIARQMIGEGARNAAVARATGMSLGALINLIAREGLQRAWARNPPKGIAASAEKQEAFLQLVLANPTGNRAELGRVVGISRPT